MRSQRCGTTGPAPDDVANFANTTINAAVMSAGAARWLEAFSLAEEAVRQYGHLANANPEKYRPQVQRVTGILDWLKERHGPSPQT